MHTTTRGFVPGLPPLCPMSAASGRHQGAWHRPDRCVNPRRRGIVARPRMRPSWLVLSLCAHAVAVAAAVGFSVHIGTRRLVPPRVEILPTVASVPVPPPAQPLPPVREEQAVADPMLPEVRVVEAIEPPPPPPDRPGTPMPQSAAPPSLQRVVPAALERTEPAEPVAAAAEPSATVEAVRRADNEPPNYPEHDRRLGHEGVVVLTVAVAASGDVHRVDLKTPCPYPGLNREAVRAVRAWRFEPARRHGEPVSSETDVEIEFRLRSAAR